MSDLTIPPFPATNNLQQYITGFENLDKWKGCQVDDAPERLVFQHNLARASQTRFPSVLEIGKSGGLSDHEVAAIFGWTTGDYRLINPIARGEKRVAFDDYPFLPNKLTKATCILTREDVLPYVHVLNSALSKLPAQTTTTSAAFLWRGHRRPVRQTVGQLVVLRGFTSVSRDRENGLSFAKKANEGRSSKRSLLVIVEHQSSRCLSKLSARRDEMEVLFPLDTTFEVVAPPDDHDSEGDTRAAKEAERMLREEIPDAEIDVVYLKEVAVQDWS